MRYWEWLFGRWQTWGIENVNNSHKNTKNLKLWDLCSLNAHDACLESNQSGSKGGFLPALCAASAYFLCRSDRTRHPATGFDQLPSCLTEQLLFSGWPKPMALPLITEMESVFESYGVSLRMRSWTCCFPILIKHSEMKHDIHRWVPEIHCIFPSEHIESSENYKPYSYGVLPASRNQFTLSATVRNNYVSRQC